MMFLYEIHFFKFGQKSTIYAYGKTTVEEDEYWILLDDKKHTVLCVKADDFVAAIKLKDTLKAMPGEEHELTKDISTNVQSAKSRVRPHRKLSKND